MKNRILKQIPNLITLSRIISSILATITFISGNFPFAIGLYVYSAISDALNGIAARKLNAFSELGRKLDAASDKLFILSLILPTIVLGNYLMMLPFSLEGIIAINNLKMNKKCKRVVTERIGKFKTSILFPTMILGLIACKVPVFNIILLPFVAITTNLQYKTLKQYQKQFVERQEGTYIEVDNNKVFSKEVSLKDNLLYLRNELMNYIYYEEPINNSINYPINHEVKRKELKR